MLKFYSMEIVFQEVPDEISLAINITNCPNLCPNCHSPWLREDIGKKLTREIIDNAINKYKNQITCILFMGGDHSLEDIIDLSYYIKESHKEIKTAWYSGKNKIPNLHPNNPFNYIKIGEYQEEKGGLNNPKTNQRLYKLEKEEIQDITNRFWKK